MSKKLSIKVKPENAFRSIAKGWKEAERSIPAVLLEELHGEILKVTGSVWQSTFIRRLNGETEISYREYLQMKEVFARYGIKDPYGACQD